MPNKQAFGQRQAQNAGFTLIEVMLVVVIVGILAAVVVMSLDLDGGNRQLEHESRRLAAIIEAVTDEAVSRQEILGLSLTADGIELWQLDQTSGNWEELKKRERLRSRYALAEGVTMALEHPGEPPVASTKNTPDVFFLPTGEVTPVTLQLQDVHQMKRTVTLDELGHVNESELADVPGRG